MFVDHAKITVHGGRGGRGCVSFLRSKMNRHGSPDGGNGGQGGDVIIRADRNLATLADFIYQPSYQAGHGANGGSNNKYGRAGQSVTLRVPVGTIVRDAADGAELADLKTDGQHVLVARGGRGGCGNVRFKSSANRSPRYAEPGAPGETRELECELKLLADIGLVGFPNAGKSTLISAITRAHARIASYPFTTLKPQLGLIELPDYSTAVIADLPGIVEGAHRNVGLGHGFLKHIERCSVLLVLLDMAGMDQRDPGSDYRVLLDELDAFGDVLRLKPRLVVANKMDVPSAHELCRRFREQFPSVELIEISARDGLGLEELKERLVRVVRAP
jgi:GTP-binding protein